MNPTWRRGSPTRTGVRSSRIRDPGAKDFQEFSKDGTKNEKEPKKQTSGLWKMLSAPFRLETFPKSLVQNYRHRATA